MTLVVNEVKMKEGFLLLLSDTIPGRRCQANDFWPGLDTRGGALPKVRAPDPKPAPVSSTCQEQDHEVIQESDNEEAVNEGKGIILFPFECDPSNGNRNSSSQCEQ